MDNGMPEAAPESGQRREAYYCNDQGCWVAEQYFCDETGCYITGDAPVTTNPVVAPWSTGDAQLDVVARRIEVELADAIILEKEAKARSPDGAGYFAAKANREDAERKRAAFRANNASPEDRAALTPEKVVVQQGIFAPAVQVTAQVMGRKELNAFRAKVIAEHTKVISAFVDTSDSQFGQIAVKQLFKAADKDGNGTLDRQEVKDALHAFGFTFIEDKQLDTIFKRADTDKDEVIDFEEFVKETPKTLRTSLVKLAKQNGHDLGFLA
jgi:hypothetical protein